MYAMGGFDASFRPVPGIDVFDSTTGKWTSLDGSIPAAETHAGHASDGSSIYFAGGYVGALGEGRQQAVTRKVWRYDTATNTWDSVAELPGGRGGGALVRVGRELHYFGGCLGDRVTNSGAHWMLRLGNSSGGADDETTWIRRPAMPSPRDHFAAIAIDDRIFTIGGEYGHDVHHAQSKLVHSFNAITGEWTRLPDMGMGRSHMESGVFEHEGKIIVAGGQVDDFQPTGLVEQYDIVTGSWSRLPSLPEARQGGAIQKIGDTLIVALGGSQTNEPQDDVWVGEFL
jgi:N-acetylneuraminic acid mutarotase